MPSMNDTELTLLNPPNLHPTSGYAHVTIAPAGRTAHLAGLCPLDADEKLAGPDLATQIDQLVANGLAVLAAAGATPADVVRSVVYVVSDQSAVLAAAWERLTASALGPAFRTAGTLLGVAALGYGGQLVEVDLTAALAG
jgi:enamine deaminase RidA (YjgF/YER057c/UK114 family)